MNSKFLESTEVGPYPSEMQAAWDVLRSEAAANYALEEGWREEEGRETMGPLAAQTPARVRNRGATERKKARRTEAGDAKGGGRPANITVGEGERREGGDEMQGKRGDAPRQENMDELMEAMAEAIDEAEREAPETRENFQTRDDVEPEASTIRCTHEKREATARHQASNYLQAMEGTARERPEGTT